MSRPWIALACLTGVNLLNYIDRQILYAVFPPIQAELGLSDTKLGLLASAVAKTLIGKNKPFQQAITAVARELLGFVWAIGQQIEKDTAKTAAQTA